MHKILCHYGGLSPKSPVRNIDIYTKSSVISRGDSNTMYAAWLHPWFWLGRIARPLPPRRVQPPILSRVYQTLSRGFVNLLNAKKIADTRHGGMQNECCYFWLLMDVCSVPCLPLCTEKRDEKSGSSLASWYWWYCDSQGWFTVLKVWSALLVWQIPLSIFAAHQRPLAACLDNHGWPYQLPFRFCGFRCWDSTEVGTRCCGLSIGNKVMRDRLRDT